MVDSRTPLIHHGRVKDFINFEKTSDKNLKNFYLVILKQYHFIYEVGNSSPNPILFVLPNKSSILRRGERDLEKKGSAEAPHTNLQLELLHTSLSSSFHLLFVYLLRSLYSVCVSLFYSLCLFLLSLAVCSLLLCPCVSFLRSLLRLFVLVISFYREIKGTVTSLFFFLSTHDLMGPN